MLSHHWTQMYLQWFLFVQMCNKNTLLRKDSRTLENYCHPMCPRFAKTHYIILSHLGALSNYKCLPFLKQMFSKHPMKYKSSGTSAVIYTSLTVYIGLCLFEKCVYEETFILKRMTVYNGT